MSGQGLSDLSVSRVGAQTLVPVDLTREAARAEAAYAAPISIVRGTDEILRQITESKTHLPRLWSGIVSAFELLAEHDAVRQVIAFLEANPTATLHAASFQVARSGSVKHSRNTLLDAIFHYEYSLTAPLTKKVRTAHFGSEETRAHIRTQDEVRAEIVSAELALGTAQSTFHALFHHEAFYNSVLAELRQDPARARVMDVADILAKRYQESQIGIC